MRKSIRLSLTIMLLIGAVLCFAACASGETEAETAATEALTATTGADITEAVPAAETSAAAETVTAAEPAETQEAELLSAEALGIKPFDRYSFSYYLSYCRTPEVFAPVTDLEQLKEEAYELWMSKFGEKYCAASAEEMFYRINYEYNEDIWLLQGGKNKTGDGGICGIMVEAASGIVMAVWSDAYWRIGLPY